MLTTGIPEEPTYLLAYNLLRSVMYETGTTFDRNPVRLSLQATRQHLDNFSSQWDSKTNKKARKIYRTMLEKVAEPRVRKRRPKAYPRFARASECSTGKNEICLTSGFRLKLAAFRYKQLPHGFLAGRFISCWTTNTRLYETRFAP